MKLEDLLGVNFTNFGRLLSLTGTLTMINQYYTQMPPKVKTLMYFSQIDIEIKIKNIRYQICESYFLNFFLFPEREIFSRLVRIMENE